MAGGDAAGDGPMDLLSDALHLSLHTATYVPTQATDEVKATATNELASAGGYPAVGEVLASKTYASASLVTTFDAADVAWAGFTNIFRYGVVWDNTPTTPADPLIMYVDTGGTQDLSATTLTFQWNASGLFTITVA